MKLKEINVMKRICLLFLLTVAITYAFAQSEEDRQRHWDSFGYGKFYVVTYERNVSSIHDPFRDAFMDDTWRDFEMRWESGDYVFVKTCEYYTSCGPLEGTEAVLFPDPVISDGVCLANTLVDVKTPVTDDFVIPSMPDINLFFVDLDFIIKQKNHLNSLTIPNMIRGVYSSSGEKLYVDTLYVEGDYECMINNRLVDKSERTVYNKIRYRDYVNRYYINDVFPFEETAIEGKEPVLIAKMVIYEGKPIKSYTKRGKGVGLGCEETYLNYLMANQWGDQIESVELTDKSLRGIASNAFNGCKTLKRVKITFPEWGGYFAEMGSGRSRIPHILIGSKAFYGCENLEVCDLGDDSITVYDKTGLDEPNRFYFGDSVFAYCTKLDTFRCKNQHMVKDIGNCMFLGCENLRYVGNWDDIETIGSRAFKGCNKICDINSENLKSVGSAAFEGNTSISGHVSVPNAEVYSGAFRNCVNLESIDFYKYLTYGECFKGCTALEYVNVNGLESYPDIGKGFFEDCVNLKGISFNGSGYGKTLRLEEFKRIDTCAFKNCRSLVDVAICSEPYKLYRRYPSSVGEDEMRVFDSAFVGSGIKSVTLSYVNAANAFDDCVNLESATFWGPDEGRNTFELPDFRNCPKLKKIVVNGGGWDLEAQVTLKDEQTVKVIDNLDGLYLLGKPHIYVGDYPNYNFANTILYVPKGMKNVYRENALAPTFKDIVELTDEQVGIIKVTIDGAAENGNGDAAVYDLSGQRVLKTIPGNVYVSKGRKFIAK